MRLLTVMLFTAALTATAQDIHVRVDPSGPGSIDSLTDYKTVQQALDHAPQPPAPFRLWIDIDPGTYAERINVTQNRPRITLHGLGQSPADTIITAAQNARSAGGTFFTETAEINGDNFEADNLTFANTAGDNGQAVAAAVRSDRAVFKHVRFLGDQDTLFADYGRQYYVDSYIEGGVDFIFGNATAVFDRCELHEIRSGYLTAQSRTSPTQPTGYVITNSRVTRADCLGDAPECRARALFSFFLGRPWRAYSRVVFMNTELPQDLNPTGWSRWKKDDLNPQAFYAEFNNTGPGAGATHRAPWSHQLTATEAEQFAPDLFLAGTDHWAFRIDASTLPDLPQTLNY
jgi:pectinesterase